MNTLSKGLIASLPVLFITACGGGGGGSEGTNDNTANAGSVISLPATTQNSEASSGHNTSQLNFNTNITVDSSDHSVYGTTKIYNYSNPQKGLFIDHKDKIELFADGKKVTLTEDFSINFGTSYSYTLPNNASSYEFRYTRNDEFVSEGSLDSLPQTFGASGTVNGEEVSITLDKSANHTYEYILESLICKYNVDDITALAKHIDSRDGEGMLTDDYHKNIALLFDTNIDDLKTEFSTCSVEVFFSSKSESINTDLSSKNISIFATSTQIIEVELF
ncbi:hypothetical protein [Photobacterium lutimaris]|uniref:Lipoprotein n=1 Tax=Photobacterium lutimaris TaxID=388278 RepID=A0A2T3J308_9GAMM|nr:hypothetical protein [Photobacterium lutimaris]PSU35646.1 hypothetical protein C9I99_01085 [Photobacterium lutimaris]TDR78700.1 hypothetical protein DFP78_101213 [Photobacterium lutimaris]